MGAMSLYRDPEFLESASFNRPRADDGWDPRALLGEPKHCLQVLDGTQGSWTIGLVDYQDVSYLQQPSLVGLDLVAPAGCEHDDYRVRLLDHVYLGLANADGLEHYPRPARGFEEADGIGYRASKST